MKKGSHQLLSVRGGHSAEPEHSRGDLFEHSRTDSSPCSSFADTPGNELTPGDEAQLNAGKRSNEAIRGHRCKMPDSDAHWKTLVSPFSGAFGAFRGFPGL